MCHFYKNEVCFLYYVVLAQEVQTKDKKIEKVKNWLKLKSRKNIQVFFGFANFYKRFIQSFSKITRLCSSIFKSTSLAKNLWSNMIEDVEVSSISDVNDKTVKRLLVISKNWKRAADYLSSNARLAFIQLKNTFIKALIFWCFDSKCHIRIQTDTSNHSIGRISSQLTLNDLA